MYQHIQSFICISGTRIPKSGNLRPDNLKLGGRARRVHAGVESRRSQTASSSVSFRWSENIISQLAEFSSGPVISFVAILTDFIFPKWHRIGVVLPNKSILLSGMCRGKRRWLYLRKLLTWVEEKSW